MEIGVRFMRRQDLPVICRYMRDERVLRGTLQLPSLQAAWLARWLEDTQQAFSLVAEVGEGCHAGRVVGLVRMGRLPGRQQHVAGLFIAVDLEFHGRGIGTRLLGEALRLAEEYWHIVRVELGVYADNEPALRLYRRFGFQVEGRRVAGAIRDGQYADELIMARLRPPADGVPPPQPWSFIPAAQKESDRSGFPRGLDVRPPAPGDAPALTLLYADPALVRNSLLVPFELPGQEQLARELESASPDRGHVFVATLGGRVCGEVRLECGRGRMAHRGTVTLLVPPDDGRLAAEIPRYRASAVARALLTAVLDLADRWLLLPHSGTASPGLSAWEATRLILWGNALDGARWRGTMKHSEIVRPSACVNVEGSAGM